MAAYDLHIYCETCNQTHPKGVNVQFDGGPARKISVGAFYADKHIPRQLEAFVNGEAVCPKTGTMFKQDDLFKIFLIPVDYGR